MTALEDIKYMVTHELASLLVLIQLTSKISDKVG